MTRQSWLLQQAVTHCRQWALHQYCTNCGRRLRNSAIWRVWHFIACPGRNARGS